MSWQQEAGIMLEIFQEPFMQAALAAGIMIGILTGFYGVFVVQRGLSFLGNGLAYAAFSGIALALLLGQEPLWVALPFTILVALGIIWLQDRSKLSGDTAIGIFFAVSMALGVVFISLAHSYSVDAFSYLFGSILTVNSMDLTVTGILLLVSILMWPLWGRWAYSTFDRELALADRMPVKRYDYLLSILIAITVVVATKIVGVVLIASFLVIPAATARLLAKSFAAMTLISIVLGVATTFIGLAISYQVDMPSGAIIILAQAVLFFMALLFQRK
jgi:zinc transport system permease protein